MLTTSPTSARSSPTMVGDSKSQPALESTLPELNHTDLKLRGDDNFALGFSTNQAENFQGYHGKAVLIIADEAPGIESGIWDAVAGIMAGGTVSIHLTVAGNPTIHAGAFFDAFGRERDSGIVFQSMSSIHRIWKESGWSSSF